MKKNLFQKKILFFKIKTIKVLKSELCIKVDNPYKLDQVGPCDGDSGGPLVLEGKVIIGLLSSGPQTCNEVDAPNIFVRISFYLDFIEKARHKKSDENQENRQVINVYKLDYKKTLGSVV